MAMFSVWDWNSNSYRVYATPQTVSVGDDPVSPKPSSMSPIGADPDTQVNTVPSGARFIGNSHMARGEIRRLSNGMGDVSAPETTPLWKQPVVMFASGALAFWLVSRWF